MAKAALRIVIERMESNLAPLMIRLRSSEETVDMLLRKWHRAPLDKAMRPSAPAIRRKYELAKSMFIRIRRLQFVPLWRELAPLKIVWNSAVNTWGIKIEQALGKHLWNPGCNKLEPPHISQSCSSASCFETTSLPCFCVRCACVCACVHLPPEA